jgi:hypothetical protein
MQEVRKQNINKQLKYLLLLIGCAFTLQINAQPNAKSYFGSFKLYNPIKNVDIKSPIIASTTPLARPSSLVFSVPKAMPVAFFCRMEHIADKKSKFNPRFRLGSVDYVNKLEGKSYQIE